MIDFATGPQVLDAAIHLVFDVPDIETGLAALRPLREARLRSRAGADAWIPHPALSDARACGSDGMRAFTHATSKLARPERLTRVAWSFLEADGGSWTFEGEDLVDPSDARSEEGFFLTGARPGREPLDGDAAPGARGSPRHADFNRWFLGTSDPEGALRDTAFDVLDPEVVSAAPGRPDSASCVECHVGQGVLFHYDLMTDRAVDLGRERLGRLARLDGHVPALLSEKCPLLRGLGNMRAFGYGPGGECGVSLRTVAEVESALRFLNAPPAR